MKYSHADNLHTYFDIKRIFSLATPITFELIFFQPKYFLS